MVDARARTTRRSHQAEDPAQIPAQLAQPPEEPAGRHPNEMGGLDLDPPSAVQRTEKAVTSLRDDLRELIALLKGRPEAPPVSYAQRLEALQEARVYVEGLINARGAFKASAGPESRLNLELQVAAYLIGERIEPPQLPAGHLENLKR
jgi:hypothetical protein